MFIVLEKKNFIIFNIGETKVIGNFTSDLKLNYFSIYEILNQNLYQNFLENF